MSRNSKQPTTDADSDLINLAQYWATVQDDILGGMRRLIEVHHADANVTARDGKTALMCVASKGHLSACRLLVETGHANVDAVNRVNGWTALMYASVAGHLFVCQFLVATDHANVGAVDSSGMTALMHACLRGHLLICQCLVATGHADVEAKSRSGCTALHLACRIGNLGIAKNLIESGGAKVETTDDEGRNALQQALRTCNPPELVQYLARKLHVGIDAIDPKNGRTALHWVCLYRTLKTLKCLIEEGGANVKAVVATTGETALHFACRNVACGNNFDLILYLVETCQVDTLVLDHLGRSALHVAATHFRRFHLVFYLMGRYPVH